MDNFNISFSDSLTVQHHCHMYELALVQLVKLAPIQLVQQQLQQRQQRQQLVHAKSLLQLMLE